MKKMKMPPKPAKKGVPPMKKMDTDMGERPKETERKPKAIRTRKI